MEQALETAAYGLQDFVAELRAIAAATADPQRIIARVRPLAQRMALNKAEWLTPEMYHCEEEQGVGLTVLHEESDHSLAVFAVAWLPGRGVPPHDHGTWAVVAGVDGLETNAFWKRVDDGAREGYAEIVKSGEKVFADGEVLSMLPGAIHSVRNATEQTTVSLHTYGMHINFTDRSQFDPEANREEPFIIKVN